MHKIALPYSSGFKYNVNSGKKKKSTTSKYHRKMNRIS